MRLGKLIEFLEKQDQDKILPIGFHYPHSYRGNYDELAFEPKENVAIADMLKDAKSALGSTFTGWKGGLFKMNKHTLCHISEVGLCYECPITKFLICCMVGCLPDYNGWEEIFSEVDK